VVPETERRKSHIDLISTTHHPLLPIATTCLSYIEEDRPSAQELCHHLAALKEAPQYGKSVQQTLETNQPAQTITADREGGERMSRDLQWQFPSIDDQIQEKDAVIAAGKLDMK